ncbi:SMI1/KNR4 family protein [Gloeocapsopsis dulcis]|uniref:SMI1/KNR4 family protein n=1 Tax=Gloeocapsopsis dulcis TaxID=2859516 RepID=UPI0012DAF12C|nr:SMI1/KNR4 family protein [Gloeocapsopsis dulcis]WNN91185.1 SMI1/KNR4 family protein [Gloeocapsopsis dulcis]
MFEWLPEQIEQAKIISKEFEQGWKFRLNPPATKADIDSCEAALGIPLPPSYREFLLQWNGAHLFYTHKSLLPDGNVWYHEGRMFSIQSTHELFDFNQEERGDLSDEEWDSLILFCNYNGGGDSCGLNPAQTTNSEYAVLDCDHDSHPVEWRQAKIASSFAE